MSEETQRLLSAAWLNDTHGLAVLKEDWTQSKRLPPLRIEPGETPLASIQQAPPEYYAKHAGYYIDGTEVTFFLWPGHFPNVDLHEKRVYVAGDFNKWADAVGRPEWQLQPGHYEGQRCYRLTLPVASVCPKKKDRPCFKFVTNNYEWAEVPADSPNRVVDENGNANLALDRIRAGRHLFFFEPAERHPILGREKLVWKGRKVAESIVIDYGHLLADMRTDAPLGASIQQGKTVFRLFAPRATAVRVHFFESLAESAPHVADLHRVDEAVWERVVPSNLSGWYYHYSVDGENVDNFSNFDPAFHILDPYALAAVNGKGPGIIIDRARLPKRHKEFRPPAWHDLIIMEAHVRDLVAQTSLKLSAQERRGFAGVAKWLRSESCYLVDLGINAVELQPIQENDAPSADTYHWGYMTCNYFAPASIYGTNPLEASQIEEFKDMVDAFHEREIAVILDVVYNHVGEPAHLLFIDKQYYFETNTDGDLMNWSGCGNDLKASAPMSLRLIIDSLTHLVETYDVDGFRFDLAELLGVDVLKAIETALKKVKPSIILIAEPWSFRGHIAQSLRQTGWASWNDGYRDFAAQYVRGQGTRDPFRYFISGSPHYFAMFPAQTVNYTESHDDRCWLDKITENRDFNGSWPTLNDRRRTHLMAALLFSSLGIPMIAEGQDFLRSKQGINNTYQRGDINALDYKRICQFPTTHAYYKGWIAFRLSPQGRLLRLASRQTDGYLKFFEWGDTSSIGVLYNADGSLGPAQLFFAINPHHYHFEMPIDGLDLKAFQQIADHERFHAAGLPKPHFRFNEEHLYLPPMSSGLWLKA